MLATLDKLALFNEASSEEDVVVMVAEWRWRWWRWRHGDDDDDDDGKDNDDDDYDGVMVTCYIPNTQEK